MLRKRCWYLSAHFSVPSDYIWTSSDELDGGGGGQRPGGRSMAQSAGPTEDFPAAGIDSNPGHGWALCWPAVHRGPGVINKPQGSQTRLAGTGICVHAVHAGPRARNLGLAGRPAQGRASPSPTTRLIVCMFGIHLFAGRACIWRSVDGDGAYA